MTSKSTIYNKLLAFQQLGISVKKDAQNPHFRSTYATLNEVLDKVKEPLNGLGIVIIFQPETDGLTTILHDVESGQEVKSFMRYVGADNAQKLLACNTYFRRGSLVSLLGLEDEDDDGNTAVAPAKVDSKTTQSSAAPKPASNLPEDNRPWLSDAEFKDAMRQIGDGDTELFTIICRDYRMKKVYREELKKIADLSKALS